MQRRITADEIAARKCGTDLQPGEKAKGRRPGTIRMWCDWCGGKGVAMHGGNPAVRCVKCDGRGEREIVGTRHGDLPKSNRMLVKEVLLCIGVGMVVTAIVIAILTWKYGF